MTDESDSLSPAPSTGLYQDLVQPTAAAVGRTSGDVAATGGEFVRLLTRPFQSMALWGNLRFNELDERIRLSFERREVPIDALRSPPSHLAGPLLMSFTFAQDDPSLRDLYVELLATSMTEDGGDRIHPSFAELLRQLSPDEARLLPALFGSGEVLVARADLLKPIPPRPGVVVGSKISTWSETVVTIPEWIELLRPGRLHLYVDNLQRLGIVEVRRDERLAGPNAYQPIVDSVQVRNLEQRAEEEGASVHITPYLLETTALGRTFIDECMGRDGREQFGNSSPE